MDTGGHGATRQKRFHLTMIYMIYIIIIIKDLHLIMGQKHLIWDRVWDVKSTKSNLYLHYTVYIYVCMYVYYAPIVLFLHEHPLTLNLDIVDISRYTDICVYIYPYRSI